MEHNLIETYSRNGYTIYTFKNTAGNYRFIADIPDRGLIRAIERTSEQRIISFMNNEIDSLKEPDIVGLPESLINPENLSGLSREAKAEKLANYSYL